MKTMSDTAALAVATDEPAAPSLRDELLATGLVI